VSYSKNRIYFEKKKSADSYLLSKTSNTDKLSRKKHQIKASPYPYDNQDKVTVHQGNYFPHCQLASEINKGYNGRLEPAASL
jgi:hypothetical protein